VESPRDWGAVDIGSPTDAPAKAAPPRTRGETPASSDDEFLTQSPASVFAEDRGEAPFADIPGFEKEARFFVEAAGQPELGSPGQEQESEPEDGRFVVDGNNTEGWDFAAGEASPQADAPEPASAREPAGADSDGFLTGPRTTNAAKGKKAPRPAPVVADEAERPGTRTSARGSVATMESEPGVVDLYALGAVDFDERVHA
jgi:hypothetical protein